MWAKFWTISSWQWRQCDRSVVLCACRHFTCTSLIVRLIKCTLTSLSTWNRTDCGGGGGGNNDVMHYYMSADLDKNVYYEVKTNWDNINIGKQENSQDWLDKNSNFIHDGRINLNTKYKWKPFVYQNWMFHSICWQWSNPGVLSWIWKHSRKYQHLLILISGVSSTSRGEQRGTSPRHYL